MGFVSYLNYFSCQRKSPEVEFQEAIANGNVQRLNELGNNNIHRSLPNGELPLNYAVKRSNLVAAQALLKLGADPLNCDAQHLNALSIAYFKKDYKLVEELFKTYTENKQIKLDAEWMVRDSKGLAPLHYAAALGILKIEGEKQLSLNKECINPTNLARQLDRLSPLAISTYDLTVLASSVALGVIQIFRS